MEYKTIKDSGIDEIVEKKSKFIAQIFYIKSREEAEKIILEVKKKYNDARHNCFAYSVYDESTDEFYNRFSDDGEPAGTAGASIFSVLNGNNLVNVLVIVTRYFGGILLGTGGLAKAYKDVTEKVVQNSKIYKIIKGYEVKVNIDYNLWDKFNYFCKINDINIIKTDFFEKIDCIFEISKEKFAKGSSYYNENNIVRQKLIISDL